MSACFTGIGCPAIAIEELARIGADTFEVKGAEGAYKVAVERVRILSRWDDDKRRSGKSYWRPTLGYSAGSPST